MSPNLQVTPLKDLKSPNQSPTPSPLSSLSSFTSDEEISLPLTSTTETTYIDENALNEDNLTIEDNLQSLLVKIASTDALDTVTQIKLRVITQEISLQNLSVYLPSIRELILDGSILTTLRDLGLGLKCVKILKINHCNLRNFDGISNFENLEELYANDNFIEDLTPCAFLINIKIIDLKRNILKNLVESLSFLGICENLQHISLDGNDEMKSLTECGKVIKTLLPSLQSLDGISLNSSDSCENPTISKNVPNESFTVTFPPRVCLLRHLEGSRYELKKKNQLEFVTGDMKQNRNEE